MDTGAKTGKLEGNWGWKGTIERKLPRYCEADMRCRFKHHEVDSMVFGHEINQFELDGREQEAKGGGASIGFGAVQGLSRDRLWGSCRSCLAISAKGAFDILQEYHKN